MSEVTITVSLSDVLNVPSLFTPNNDGNNDFLVIPGIEGHPNSKLEIINRHGASVFETTAYRNDFWRRWRTSCVIRSLRCATPRRS